MESGTTTVDCHLVKEDEVAYVGFSVTGSQWTWTPDDHTREGDALLLNMILKTLGSPHTPSPSRLSRVVDRLLGFGVIVQMGRSATGTTDLYMFIKHEEHFIDCCMSVEGDSCTSTNNTPLVRMLLKAVCE